MPKLWNRLTHILQVGYLAMTTNERMNAARYPRFHTGGAEFYGRKNEVRSS